jgi:hypothetical protein
MAELAFLSESFSTKATALSIKRALWQSCWTCDPIVHLDCLGEDVVIGRRLALSVLIVTEWQSLLFAYEWISVSPLHLGFQLLLA